MFIPVEKMVNFNEPFLKDALLFHENNIIDPLGDVLI